MPNEPVDRKTDGQCSFALKPCMAVQSPPMMHTNDTKTNSSCSRFLDSRNCRRTAKLGIGLQPQTVAEDFFLIWAVGPQRNVNCAKLLRASGSVTAAPVLQCCIALHCKVLHSVRRLTLVKYCEFYQQYPFCQKITTQDFEYYLQRNWHARSADVAISTRINN